MSSRSDLRRQLRARRAALEPSARRQGAQRMIARLTRLNWWRRAHRIALYHPIGGEIDPLPLIRHPSGRGKRFYLPITLPGREILYFAPLRGHLRCNHLNIAEPTAARHRRLHPAALDLVILPLVGFDDQGNRLGQGAGYYDRSFAFRLNPGRIAKPRLVGVGFECQRLSELNTAPWDVPLDAVVTQSRAYLR